MAHLPPTDADRYEAACERTEQRLCDEENAWRLRQALAGLHLAGILDHPMPGRFLFP
jgi:hypothetical protein